MVVLVEVVMAMAVAVVKRILLLETVILVGLAMVGVVTVSSEVGFLVAGLAKEMMSLVVGFEAPDLEVVNLEVGVEMQMEVEVEVEMEVEMDMEMAIEMETEMEMENEVEMEMEMVLFEVPKASRESYLHRQGSWHHILRLWRSSGHQ